MKIRNLCKQILHESTDLTVSFALKNALELRRNAIANAITRAKAKARLRSAFVAVPVVGVGAIAYFEEQDYQEWLEQNPDGTRQQYACEAAEVTAEVVDEVLQELPEVVQPDPETVLSRLPEC